MSEKIAEVRPNESVGTLVKSRTDKVGSRSEPKKVTNYHKCRHYDGKSTIKCMIPDLCRERGIEHCPYRTRWSQSINETDHEYFEWCLNHPIDGDALYRTVRDTPPNEAQIRGVR